MVTYVARISFNSLNLIVGKAVSLYRKLQRSVKSKARVEKKTIEPYPFLAYIKDVEAAESRFNWATGITEDGEVDEAVYDLLAARMRLNLAVRKEKNGRSGG